MRKSHHLSDNVLFDLSLSQLLPKYPALYAGPRLCLNAWGSSGITGGIPRRLRSTSYLTFYCTAGHQISHLFMNWPWENQNVSTFRGNWSPLVFFCAILKRQNYLRSDFTPVTRRNEYFALTMRETWGPEELLAEEEPWNSQAQNIWYDVTWYNMM